MGDCAPAGGLLRVVDSGNLCGMTSSAAPRQNRNPMQQYLMQQPLKQASGGRRFSIVSALALGFALAACSGTDEADGMPTFGNTPPFSGSSVNGSAGAANNVANN